MLDAFFTTIGHPELLADERFSTPMARRQNGYALWEIIAGWTRQRTKWQVMETLGEAGVPCSAVYDTLDVFTDKHLRTRDAIMTIDHPVRGAWEYPAPPVHLSDSRVDVAPAPLLGEHTADVLCEELGLSVERVDQLAEAGVLGVLQASPAGA
jgi:formyl-CoA transferase